MVSGWFLDASAPCTCISFVPVVCLNRLKNMGILTPTHENVIGYMSGWIYKKYDQFSRPEEGRYKLPVP
jgi:hypothetical protein